MGRDPAHGHVKKCYCTGKADRDDTDKTDRVDPPMELCASEGHKCTCDPKFSHIKYGINNKWLTIPTDGTQTDCTNKRMGHDPAPNQVKKCYCTGKAELV